MEGLRWPSTWLRAVDGGIGPADDEYVRPLYARAVWQLALLLNACTYAWLFVVWTRVEGAQFAFTMTALSPPGLLWLASAAALMLHSRPRVASVLMVAMADR